MKFLISAMLALSFCGAANAAVYNNPGYATTLTLELGTNTVTALSTGQCNGDEKALWCAEDNVSRFSISLGDGMTLVEVNFEVTSYSGSADQNIAYRSFDADFTTSGVLTSPGSVDFFTGAYDGAATTNHFYSLYKAHDGTEAGDTFSYSTIWTFNVIATPQQGDEPENVPAPAALGLIGLGLVGLGLGRRRRRRG